MPKPSPERTHPTPPAPTISTPADPLALTREIDPAPVARWPAEDLERVRKALWCDRAHDLATRFLPVECGALAEMDSGRRLDERYTAWCDRAHDLATMFAPDECGMLAEMDSVRGLDERNTADMIDAGSLLSVSECLPVAQPAGAIHPALKPFFDALMWVLAWSDGVASSYASMLAWKESCGMPRADKWPGRESRWTKLMREWSVSYREWCAAIEKARQAVKSAAIMDAGESWTTQATIDLDSLAGTLHPSQVGGDGLGVVRCGLPPLPTEFPALVEAVKRRLDELRAVPADERMATPAPAVGTAEGVDWNVVQGKLLAKRERGEKFSSYRTLAEELGCSTATIRKAIKKSESLRGWAARARNPAPRAGPLNERQVDDAVQSREPDPADQLPKDEVDSIMARLIDMAKPEERAALEAMDTEQRREMAKAYADQCEDARQRKMHRRV
jgi:hypothetical protein